MMMVCNTVFQLVHSTVIEMSGSVFLWLLSYHVFSLPTKSIYHYFSYLNTLALMVWGLLHRGCGGFGDDILYSL